MVQKQGGKKEEKAWNRPTFETRKSSPRHWSIFIIKKEGHWVVSGNIIMDGAVKGKMEVKHTQTNIKTNTTTKKHNCTFYTVHNAS